MAFLKTHPDFIDAGDKKIKPTSFSERVKFSVKDIKPLGIAKK
jgi:hypothetical protein